MTAKNRNFLPLFQFSQVALPRLLKTLQEQQLEAIPNHPEILCHLFILVGNLQILRSQNLGRCVWVCRPNVPQDSMIQKYIHPSMDVHDPCCSHVSLPVGI